ncbi:MAG: DUF637 domain-containing protein [Shewanella sp.]
MHLFLSGFDQWAKLDSAAKQANNPFAQPGAADLMSWDTFNRVTGHATLSAGINSTINGGSFGDAFKDSLLANIQGQVGKSVAGVIGDNGNALGEAGKTIAHGVTSGAIAEITGDKFAAGAAGGAMSEIASNWSLGSFGGNEEYQVALNKVLGGLAAAAVTGDENNFDTGADRAEKVYRYNLLEHQFDTMMAQAEQDRVKAGLGDVDAKARVEAREQLSDAINNLTLDLLPVVGDVKGFVEVQDTLDYALAAIAVIPGGDLLKGPLKAAKEALKAGDVETANKLLEPIWSVTKSKTSVQNAYGHWQKHGAEFPEFQNAKQYVEGVRNFVKNSPLALW